MNKFYTNVSRRGDWIFHRYVENGVRKQSKVKFQPTLYFEQSGDGLFKGLKGEELGNPITFINMSFAKDAIEKHSHFYHGMDDFVIQFIEENYPGNIQFDQSQIVIANFDIEVDSGGEGFPLPTEAKYPIDSITIKYSDEEEYHVFTTKAYNSEESEINVKKKVHQFINEVNLLNSFMIHFSHKCPDIVTGWFIRTFDIPYIINRYKNVGIDPKGFSIFHIISEKNIAFKTGDMSTYEFAGLTVIDYNDAFKKFAYSYPPQESYSLNHISHVVLNEKKLSYDEYGSLHELGSKNPQKYVDYNIKDVWLVEKLDEKLGLLGLIMTMAYKAGVNYSECFGTTRIWDSIIYRELKSIGIICPPRISGQKTPYEGAYVKEPIAGKYDWVVSYDFESLYPSTIVQWNMSPETLIDELEENIEFTIASNGIKFRKDFQGIIPKIIEGYKSDRKKYKNEMLDAKKKFENTKLKEYDIQKTIANNQQMAIKILINALYGALANAYFRYYDVRIAESITLTGQSVNSCAEKAINAYLNKICDTTNVDYVIAMDTDSDYINLGPFINKLNENPNINLIDVVIRFCSKYLEPVIENALLEFYNTHKCYKPNLRMARDIIADKGIWTAKKRYLLNVLDAEGVRYETPQLKMTGLEAIRSSTPEKIRQWMKEIFPLILNGKQTEIEKAIANYKANYNLLTPEEIALPLSVNGISKYVVNNKCISGTPQQVRAAHIYNSYLKQHKLTSKYKIINDGDKIKVLTLKMPNNCHSNVIAFVDVFPREFNLNSSIDRKLMFEKSFLNPLEAILQAANISNTTSESLEDFFT